MSLPLAASPTAAPVRVMVVDDSAVIRGLVSRWLAEDPGVEVVASVMNGQEAVRRVRDAAPDVVILDVEMPVMDGLTALPAILEAAPGARVVMASTLTQRGGEVTIKALALGAADYLAKPDAGRLAAAQDYRQELLAKVKALGGARRPAAGRAHAPHAAPSVRAAAPAASAPGVVLRPTPANAPRPEILAIGCSTGGPQALREVVGQLAGAVQVPVLIVQHMPATFTAILAEHLCKQTGADVREARDGDALRPGAFLVAPGDFHMTVALRAGALRIALDKTPAENFCRPAVDPLFRSLAQHFGARAAAVVLTGMGADGRNGARPLADLGCPIIVQDEATSVVWGMPGAIAHAGLASAVKPLKDIAPAALEALRGGRR